jgi:DNA-binding transcriptional regulator GbsR (MarR family)
MALEKIKRKFVKYMEAVRAGDPYPRKFMGCLMAILIEHEPVSQDRIMELTGYSQASVSLTLQRIQLLIPIRTIKVRGDRKRYYTYDGSPASFILNLWNKRLEVQGIDINQIDSMIQRVEENSHKNAAIQRFLVYLENMKLYLGLVHSLRASSIEIYEGVMQSESIDDLDLHDDDTLEDSLVEEFLQLQRMKVEKFELDEDPAEEYLLLKNQYYTGMKANLNPLYSQTAANQMMVVHEVFLEGVTTQEMIGHATLLPRSTISELLAQFVKLGIIEVTKKEASRIKLYRPEISFTDLMLSYSERLSRDAIAGKSQLSEFISATRKTRSRSKEATKFLDVLNNFVKAYEFTHRFTMRFKVKMVTRLKEEYDRGFVFI